MKPHKFSRQVKDDALSILLGKQLGNGISREVYTCPLKPDEWVVKIESPLDNRESAGQSLSERP